MAVSRPSCKPVGLGRFGMAFNASLFRSMAAAMKENGLLAAGYDLISAGGSTYPHQGLPPRWNSTNDSNIINLIVRNSSGYYQVSRVISVQWISAPQLCRRHDTPCRGRWNNISTVASQSCLRSHLACRSTPRVSQGLARALPASTNQRCAHALPITARTTTLIIGQMATQRRAAASTGTLAWQRSRLNCAHRAFAGDHIRTRQAAR